jgi:hypothetical protein
LDEVDQPTGKKYFASVTPEAKKATQVSRRTGFRGNLVDSLNKFEVYHDTSNLRSKTKHSSVIHSQARSSKRALSSSAHQGNGKVDNRRKRLSHFFPLSGKWDNCAGYGIDGVFEIYTSCLNRPGIKMSGPTLFAPMISEINKFSQEKFKENPLNYTVMLILTDGVIHDMDDTIVQIVNGSKNPLSIIIVGIGTEDFQFMKILDSDNYALKDKLGRKSTRDIVQFVDYSEHQHKGADTSTHNQRNSYTKIKDRKKSDKFQRRNQKRKTEITVKDISKLAEEVLQELPKQVCAFYSMKELKPKDFKVEKRYSEMNEMEKMLKDKRDAVSPPKELRSIQEADEKTNTQFNTGNHNTPKNSLGFNLSK